MVTLIILDGFGYSKNNTGNAIASAGTPYLNKLKNIYPNTLINASGEYVGLPKGQMGNSEVGHLNLGAGKIVLQDLPRINNAISNGEFEKNKVLNDAFEHVNKHNSTLHLMGLFSDGGVHSHIKHLEKIIELALKNNVQKIAIHAFTDGRDTAQNYALNCIKKFKYSNLISSIAGRLYAMDREKRYDRIAYVYDALINGHTQNKFSTPTEAITKSYENGLTDEFIRPVIVGETKKISDNDSVIFFNYRNDRARELTDAITNDNFKEFKTKKINNLYFVTMTEYDETFKNVKVLFPAEKIENNLSHIIAENGLKQFHISETTKYAHVTFFFNGGIEKPNKNEDRFLIDSINTPNYADYPEMRASEILSKTIDVIASKKYDFVLVNFSNPDMLGHTGDFNATVSAIKLVDKCAYLVAMATQLAGGDCILCADHGNAEKMLENGKPHTAHTCNPVPFILVSDKNKNVKLISNGKLANVAPTILKLLDLKIPNDMDKPMF